MTLPVYRRSDVPLGQAYYLPSGVLHFYQTPTYQDLSLQPGIYVNVDDQRTDDEIESAMLIDGCPLGVEQ